MKSNIANASGEAKLNVLALSLSGAKVQTQSRQRSRCTEEPRLPGLDPCSSPLFKLVSLI
jgi:hypothetical protein